MTDTDYIIQFKKPIGQASKHRIHTNYLRTLIEPPDGTNRNIAILS